MSSRRTWAIPRRTMLRGLGATLALPWLQAMAGSVAASEPAAVKAAAARPPVRLGLLYFPNGVWERDWFPRSDGADYELTPSLAPLAHRRHQVLVFSGLDKRHSHGGDGHYAKTANYLTGLPVFKTTGKDLSVGSPSLDQVYAQHAGHLTPLPSLELGIDPVISGIDTITGYTRLYGSYVAWRSASQPLAREIDPYLAYHRLFGAVNAQRADDARARQRSGDRRLLLDLVLGDANALRGRLGRDDQFKLDEYLDAVRDVERRTAFFSSADPREWRPDNRPDSALLAAPAGAPGDHREHVRLMFDLLVLAFWTDTTRVGSFMFANDVSGRNFGALIPGTSGAHHEFSHHQDKPEKYEPYQRINHWHVEQYAYLLDRLAAVHEGDGRLIDNCMIMCGSSMSDGNAHRPSNLPILLGGGGGGTIASGRHVACPNGTPLCNLYLALLQRMGVPVERFGDSTGALALS